MSELPTPTEGLAWILWIWLMIHCIRQGGLVQSIRQHSYLLHLTLGTIVGLAALWRLRAGIYEGLELHFVALTVTTLIFGWRNAILVGSAALLILTLLGVEQWQQAGAIALLGVATPVLLSFGILTLSHNTLPRNLWIYIFIDGFLNGILCFVARTLLLAAWYSSQYDWTLIRDNYLILMPLFFFPEAMLNGFSTTLLVVHKPHWLATWREEQYLK